MSAAAGDPLPPRRAWLNSLFVDHALLRLPWRNWGVVDSGRLYRSNHPLPWQLREATRRFGLKTVINLRGHRTTCGSDALARREAAELGLVQHDFALESRNAPRKERILGLMQLYRSMQEPALIHCKSGADRTGIGAGVWVLLQGGSGRQAMAQLTLRHGHIRQSNTGILDAFFALYAQEEERSGKSFVDWLEQDYDREALIARFKSRGWADVLTDRILRRE